MKYFLYVRKSTDDEDRQVLSIEAQLAELKEFAAKEKLEIAASFVEAKTAKEPGRMRFGEMLERLEAGVADGIIAWHPDRLARNPIDGGKIIYMVDTGKIKSLKFPTFWFENTPQGKFMLNIAFGQSKYFIDNLSENVKRGLRQKVRRGEHPNKAPAGYRNDLRTRQIVKDKTMSKIVYKLFDLYATGEYTLQQITDAAEDMGLITQNGRILSLSMIHRMLNNPFYYGMFRFKGELYQGIHEPIITKKLFDQVQEVLARRGHKYNKKPVYCFAFTKFMQCGTCGCAITAEKKKGHSYYRCTKKKGTCNEKYIREELLTQELRQEIEKVTLPDSWIEVMKQEVEQEKQTELEKSSGLVKASKDKIRQLENRLDILLDSRLDNEIDKDEYVKKKEILLNQKIKLEEDIEEIRREGNNWLEPLRDFILELNKAKKAAQTDNLLEIKTFLKNIGSNFILKGKKFEFYLNLGWRDAKRSSSFSSPYRHGESNPGLMAENHLS